MNVRCAGTGSLWSLLVLGFLAHADAQEAVDPLIIAHRIDEHIQQLQRSNDIPSAPIASDAEFVRRIHLDLAGRIPSAATVRAFIADANPNKRQQLIDQLLDSPQYLNHFTNLWSRWLLPDAAADEGLRYISTEFNVWMRKQVADNVGYDRLVRQLITARLPDDVSSPYSFYSGARESSPAAFFASSDVRPETAATAAARLFLGLRVDCAQCHDHPTADWKQEQYWSFAAFFNELQPKRQILFGLFSVRSKNKPPMIRIPNTDIRVAATFLDGTQPEFKRSPRELLAEWLTSDSNPYFARAAVNRMWSHFFGRGLVDPVDDMGDAEGTHPALLQELAAAFRNSGYDQKFLIRAIANSQTYQLASRVDDPRQLEPRWYARFAPKKMTGYQLYESIQEAAGGPYADLFAYAVFTTGDQQVDRLRELVEGGNERRIEKPTSLLEALTLMNGSFVQSAIDENYGRLVRGVVEMPGLTDEQRLATIFLAALSREPTLAEQERLLVRLQQASDDVQRQAFFSDVMWALLNSSEFIMNH